MKLRAGIEKGEIKVKSRACSLKHTLNKYRSNGFATCTQEILHTLILTHYYGKQAAKGRKKIPQHSRKAHAHRPYLKLNFRPKKRERASKTFTFDFAVNLIKISSAHQECAQEIIKIHDVIKVKKKNVKRNFFSSLCSVRDDDDDVGGS
jgi:hypothetical protein